ncbi:MAG: putative LPS assembly protein LptD, partial [Gemmatimonadaceae bacterium]
PLKVFEQDLSNSFSLRSGHNKFPELVKIYDVVTGDSIDTRIFQEIYQTDFDWTPSFQLPPLKSNRWNLAPSIALSNVDPGAFMVASERTNGRFATQSKRLTYSLSASPTIYGLFRGFGPFAALRHTLTPQISYTYAPQKAVGDDYLLATRRSRKGYLGSLRQNSLSFGLNTGLEAKMAGDSARGGGRKVKVVSLTLSSFNYNFERLRAPEVTGDQWWRGLTTERFSYSVSSDLLPGIQFSSDYSLFQGTTTSDTAVFKPYRESMSATLNLSRTANPLGLLAKLFGKAVSPAQHAPVVPVDASIPADQAGLARELVAQPVAGARTSNERFVTPPAGGWRAAFTLSSSRRRPPVGGNIVTLDTDALCQQRANGQPFLYQQCLENEKLNPTQPTASAFQINGAPFYQSPPTMNIGANVGFNLTPRWSVAWQTNYDAQRHEFASHVVSLQRDLHDWRANFNFSQSPNGNFAFNFSIGLKAQPDLKFDYARNSIRSGVQF